MKRFAWILLAVFCTALAHVQPVDPVVQPRRSGCGCGGRCGMPDCALPAAHAPSAFVTERSVTVSRPESRRDDRPRLGTFVEKFFVSIDAPVARRTSGSAPPPFAPADRVPLFKAHCRLLI